SREKPACMRRAGTGRGRFSVFSVRILAPSPLVRSSKLYSQTLAVSKPIGNLPVEFGCDGRLAPGIRRTTCGRGFCKRAAGDEPLRPPLGLCTQAGFERSMAAALDVAAGENAGDVVQDVVRRILVVPVVADQSRLDDVDLLLSVLVDDARDQAGQLDRIL